MSKCLAITWFTNWLGVTGLGVFEDDYGKRKILLSRVAGVDEKADEKAVMDYGSTVEPWRLRQMLSLLVEEGG